MDARTLLALRRAPRRLWLLALLAWTLGLAFVHGSGLVPVVRLVLAGGEAEGETVASREVDRGTRAGPAQVFTVAFPTADGELRTLELETRRPDAETLARLYPDEGGVRVVYLESDPDVARLEGHLDVAWWLVGIGALIALLGTLPILDDWIGRVGHRLPPAVDATVDRLAARVDQLLGD